MKSYRQWEPDQAFLLPPSPRDWLPEGHLSFFILDIVRELDLSAIEGVIHGKDARGTRPYDPRMMVALLLYGSCVGVVSSRRLERATQEDVAFRVLCSQSQPDHSVIAEFRKTHLKALDGLFIQVLRLCQKAGLVKMGHVALDGTKVQANASKHKAMSHARMLKTEAELAAEVRALLERGVQADEEEDALYGKGKRGDELPEELARRESRLKKLREAKEALEAEAARARAKAKRERAEQAREAAENADAEEKPQAEQRSRDASNAADASARKALELAEERLAQARQDAELQQQEASTPLQRRRATRAQDRLQEAERDMDKARDIEEPRPESPAAPALPEHRVPYDKDGAPKPTAQRNFTDPDSRIMKKGSEYLQGYNCQAAVDEGHQIIVAQAVTNQAPDQGHLAPLLDSVVRNCGAAPETFTADTGYWSDANAAFCDDMGTDAHIATGRQKHRKAAEESEPSEASPRESARKQAMREKLKTEAGRAAYARRKAVAESPFGQIKEARGLRRFLLRGIEQVRAEWSLTCTGHNLLKLFRAVRAG